MINIMIFVASCFDEEKESFNNGDEYEKIIVVESKKERLFQ